jgi:predicted DNA binding protein
MAGRRNVDMAGNRSRTNMPKARLKVKPPGGPAALSTEYPDDKYRFLASRYGEDEVITFFEAETQNPEAVIQFIDEDPGISSYEVLHADEHGLVIELVILGTPAPVRTALNAGVLADNPLLIQDGWVIAEITTSQERLSRFKDEMETAGLPFEIKWVSQSRDPTELLTDRQRRVVTEAVECGYYDSPRSCSLTDLARSLSTSKSTTSGVLHRAEGRIIKEFITASWTDTE